MARKRTRIPLNVYLNSRLVGRLRREVSGAIDFQYDATWLEWQHSVPVSQSLPLRENRYIGEPVIAFFDNLLPDNDDIRRRVAVRMAAGDADPCSLLAAIDRDCVGALQFLPEGLGPDPVGLITAEAINDTKLLRYWLVSKAHSSASVRIRNSGFLLPAYGRKRRFYTGTIAGTGHTAPLQQPIF